MGIMTDHDPAETQEWVDALRASCSMRGGSGPVSAGQVARGGAADRHDAAVPPHDALPELNSAARRSKSPGNRELEHKIRSAIRWNAVAIILRANKESSELGGHIASFQSSALLYDVGFQHFWHAPSEGHGGDLIYVQGHVSPGIYARAFVEGRLTEQQLLNFRQESDGKGIPSYPHPWLMPDFWEFPTVSMGLGPLMAIYQARFLRYLDGRGLAKTDNRKVWAFLGDGECDEPESLGAISMAGRERLDNLIFVINCTCSARRAGARQRQDHPGARGCSVAQAERDQSGLGLDVGQLFAGRGRAFCSSAWRSASTVIPGFKARTARTFASTSNSGIEGVVSDLDDEVWKLSRGGHDPFKVCRVHGRPSIVAAHRHPCKDG
jgi:pyruvate dehydrogenase E1 component